MARKSTNVRNERTNRVPGEQASKPLAEYARRRDFRKTAEPRPTATRRSSKPIFVVQEHHASRLHWDFRLEADGVLKSWAVPKEPTLDPAVKRLAVHVEDHPLEYANFHGDIAEGEYGAGHVEIWDKGTYDVPPGARPVGEGISSGRVDFVLHGKRLKGQFALVRMAGRGRGDNWLLIKKRDDQATIGPTSPSKSRRIPARRAAAPEISGTPQPVHFTHEQKILFPEAGITKGDLLRYYEHVAPHLLPYLRDRPLTLERLPDGLNPPDAPHFWQKNTPAHYPSWIARVNLPSERGKAVRYALANNAQSLLYMVNQGVVTFHIYFSRIGSLDRPDFVLFDLDPPQGHFQDAVAVAKALRRVLEDEPAEAFVKTSGKSGLHVLVCWKQAGGYEQARQWALDIARRVVEKEPGLATVERRIARRGGRVYVDVMQNALGHHAVAPYVVRAVPEATVSTPLAWNELTATLDPRIFTMEAVLRRLKNDPWAELRCAVAGQET